jgi:hypothetical protein
VRWFDVGYAGCIKIMHPPRAPSLPGLLCGDERERSLLRSKNGFCGAGQGRTGDIRMRTMHESERKFGNMHTVEGQMNQRGRAVARRRQQLRCIRLLNPPFCNRDPPCQSSSRGGPSARAREREREGEREERESLALRAGYVRGATEATSRWPAASFTDGQTERTRIACAGGGFPESDKWGSSRQQSLGSDGGDARDPGKSVLGTGAGLSYDGERAHLDAAFVFRCDVARTANIGIPNCIPGI